MLSPTEIHIAGLKAASGIWVTYTSDNSARRLRAVPATSVAKIVGEDGSYTELTIDDWIVLVSEMPEPRTPPKQGDSIKLSEECTYYVMHPDKNTQVYENFNQLDRPAKAWRIHTNRQQR